VTLFLPLALVLNDTAITGNSCSDNGGAGIFNSGSVTLTNSMIIGNTAPFAADVYMALGTLTQTNSIIGVIGP